MYVILFQFLFSHIPFFQKKIQQKIKKFPQKSPFFLHIIQASRQD